MSLSCELTGKTSIVGNMVSHSNIKTKRRYFVNLHPLTLFSDVLKQNFNFRVAASTIRTVDKKGGIDGFLLNTKNAKLTKRAKDIKKSLTKKLILPDANA